MKRRISLILAAALLAVSFAGCTTDLKAGSTSGASSAATTEQKVLKVGMECAYAPFNWTQTSDKNNAVALGDSTYAYGYDVMIAQKIADGLGMKLEVVKTEWDGLLPAVTSGKIDLIIAGMSPTTERKQSIDFTDSYYASALVIVVKKDGKYASATKLADFSGAKITGQLNTFHYTVIDQISGVKKQTAMKDFPSMIVALQSGKIDGYISELPGALSAVAANPQLSYIQFAQGSGFQYDTVNTTIAVGLKKGSNLTSKINTILAGISEDQRQQMMKDAIAEQPLGD